MLLVFGISCLVVGFSLGFLICQRVVKNAVAMIKFAFELSGYYPLPSFDEIIGQTKKEELS